jgi:hypothetical protein
VKRLTSYWLTSFQFSESTRIEIRPRLKEKTEEFLKLIAEPCSQYIEEVKADVPRLAVNEWREAIQRIGRDAAGLAYAIRSLDPDCARLLDQCYVLITDSLDRREVALARIDELALACARAAKSREMNPAEGVPADRDRRRLTVACAEAYCSVTGKKPATSPNGTFAHVLLAVEHAVRATPQSQTSISKDYLESVLKPER